MSSRKKARAAFAAALTLMVLSAIATGIASYRLRTSQQWVDHTRSVQDALSNVNTVWARAGRERSQYVISGDPDVLDRYRAQLPEIRQSLESLKQLTIDNAEEQMNWTKLERLANGRILLMNKAIALKQTNASTLQKQSEITQDIVAVAGDIDDRLQSMNAEEQALLDLRVASTQRFYYLTGVLLIGAFLFAIIFLVVHYRLLSAELRGREQADTSLRLLSARLLQFQDDERRKFSRELHDSLGQYLAAVKMSLATLEPLMKGNPTYQESMNLLDRSLLETRTISHLLHPPLLDEAGLRSATQWYVEGFTQRSGITTTLEIPPNLRRLPNSIELTLFRIMQEGLTNIHRHSKSENATIVLRQSGNQVVLTIRDYGTGMPADVLERFKQNGTGVGVGLAGMRERVRQLGGQLDIASAGNGTSLTASLPLSETETVPHQAPLLGAVRPLEGLP